MNKSLKTSDFDYALPEEFIAQAPLKKRDASKLLVLDRKTHQIFHRRFFDIVDYLKPGDLLVLNDTKVIPARLIGEKEGGSAKIEVVLLREMEKNSWNCLVRPGKRLKIGSRVVFAKGKLVAEVLEKKADGSQLLRFESKGVFKQLLDKLGKVPLPPYIQNSKAVSNKSFLGKRYQTVFAKSGGASAAPTAGLHFTKPLLSKLKKKGIDIANITLHTGLATFRPVYADFIQDHKMHSEYFEIDKDCVAAINICRGRVVAVGTTVVRTLETLARKNKLEPCFGETDLFIYPGFEFKLVDALITNFHFPRSSLLMLVSAFAGREAILSAYEEAKQRKYRFFSFGDAMLIV
ncbi:MAG: tRNA preQ1(34) S-adenosylmethionine ribosyltransferase-isomerase QueA [Candidatus Margulisbacteria bacterium]|nr:tRNA preQ1(34) S-adenosylmethionine ribosyltransferase-isomerase QueA [Candidatus Margulisiibacteriota bacterium]MBU1021051.1 tRNA preQ1(34) S-adenosylmethionine ribosyltransferase-isomerase QueA [Candidatus Margulisiibacteriota bacterium]MBU1729726.1 tRNA preQ1(34) S-adenosylmethionine ribosyltransferase-isomerase QueA [Candidatus Margulisiibacteriota bacterium]MBU1955991.1 tRNA preQ1(34) S-adenosylmethionine ribosyltransferase-isomerase QueA [Candidatus Margulisiibacteriota bacterium]